ncbi:Ku protein [Streptomyces sp. NPDC048241]|uniref:non-homologous end joining protein Ku n=1 Tax=Streptomyces sp. NPDC048241 TaxID=3365521 RepID=UPI003715A438
MPHTIWNGAISFGLVTVPIRVQSATEDHSVRFHQIHTADGGRVRYRKVCELEGREVPQSEIGKGYETGGRVILITDDDLRNLPLPTARAIEIVGFVPYTSIDPLRIGDGYYLASDGAVAAKPYTLLVRALARASKVAIARFAWSGRERLGILRAHDGVLVLHALHWPDEIRDPDTLTPKPTNVTEDEIDGALALIDHMSRDQLTGDDLRDHYTEAVQAVIDAKQAEQAPPETPEPAQPTQILDLMAALNQSVQQARDARGEAPPAAPEGKRAGRKTRRRG